ncbi:MAG TPA: DUF1343 domain-containing protein [Polyangiaceae bacterium]|nr:DUF1343 domain-containing protein [Polyangiaceae bacterium]
MKTGTDRLADDPRLASRLPDRGFALLAHPASVTADLEHVSALLARLNRRPRVILGPEHGYGGEAQDMIGVTDARDLHGTPIRSLYGAELSDLSPRPEDLEGCELVVIDLQDVGSRYYTFVWTAVLVLRVAAKLGVPTLVLDRPNPLGKAQREGRSLDPRFRSFVGLEPVPVRHGLTLGEVCAWRAEVEGLPEGALTIVPCERVDDAATARDWDRPFVMTSPNMPTSETALVYPGGCLLEGTNLSDGRGTTRPFELTGAPWVDGERLARGLHATGLPGFRARPVTFQPTFHKHAGQLCGGVQVHVTDARAFRPYATYLALVALAQQAHPEHFRFRTERYEFVDDIPAFDLLTGRDEARARILAGDEPRAIAEAESALGPDDHATVALAERAAKARHVRLA